MRRPLTDGNTLVACRKPPQSKKVRFITGSSPAATRRAITSGRAPSTRIASRLSHRGASDTDGSYSKASVLSQKYAVAPRA